MFIKQMYTGCISEAAYYIENNREAVIIDPLRDIDDYIQLANERNATIKYVFQTHLHADFVSGHLNLAHQTGAAIVYGPGAAVNYPIHQAADNEVFKIGNATLTLLHTPGHTPESSCYLLADESGKSIAIFTGDTLFVGDVGRPDVAQTTTNATTEEMATQLYNSIQQKIMPLANDIVVYPAHGSGSSCGKNLGANTYSTLEQEKQYNYALQHNDAASFVKAVVDGLTDPPKYFAEIVRLNKQGYPLATEQMSKSLTPIAVEALSEMLQKEGLQLLDTRTELQFTLSFIPGSIFIGLNGRFAEWTAALLSYEQPIILVCTPGKEKEAVQRLARVGFDNVIGYLDGGIEAWERAGKPTDMIIDVEADELAMDLPFDDHLMIMDVRKESEYAQGHIQSAFNLPLNEFEDVSNLSDMDDRNNLYIHCGGGYRSVIAASILKKQGFHNLRNVLGGWKAINEIADRFEIQTATVEQED